MKKIILCILAALMLAGCQKDQPAELTNTEALCPYRISQTEEGLTVTVETQSLPGMDWQISVMPPDVCAVTPGEGAENTLLYKVTPISEGNGVLVLTGTDPVTEEQRYTLSVEVKNDKGGKLTATEATHTQKVEIVVSDDKMTYKWEVDETGSLQFRFLEDPHWQMKAEPTTVCQFTDLMYTPGGCRFTAVPLEAGEAYMTIYHQEDKLAYRVTVKVDEQLKISVGGVEEQPYG